MEKIKLSAELNKRIVEALEVFAEFNMAVIQDPKMSKISEKEQARYTERGALYAVEIKHIITTLKKDEEVPHGMGLKILGYLEMFHQVARKMVGIVLDEAPHNTEAEQVVSEITNMPNEIKEIIKTQDMLRPLLV